MRLKTPFLFTAIAVSLLQDTVLAAQQRIFSARDSIQMVRFNKELSGRGDTGILRSPNREHILVMTSRGQIASNCIESSLWLIEQRDIDHMINKDDSSSRIEPSLLVRVSAIPRGELARTAIYSPSITNVRWSSDSHSMYFLAVDARGQRRLWTIQLAHRQARPLTPIDFDVTAYDFSNNRVVMLGSYLESGGYRHAHQSTDIAPVGALAVTGKPLDGILGLGEKSILRSYGVYDLEGGRLRLMDAGNALTAAGNRALESVLRLSPDGAYAVALTTTDSTSDYLDRLALPEGWGMRPTKSELVSPYSQNPLRAYEIVNLDSGSVTRVNALDARSLYFSGGGEPTWSADGQLLLLTNVFLPFKALDPQKDIGQTSPCKAAVYERARDRIQCLVSSSATADSLNQGEVEQASFYPGEITLVLRQDAGRKSMVTFQRENDSWREKSHSCCSNPSGFGLDSQTTPRLGIYESLNERPTLSMIDDSSGDHRTIWDPNPQLKGVAIGDASIYNWKDDTGYAWSGVLVKPVDYVSGRRYPLVIQTHGFDPHSFITDGSYPTGMAARALSSAGILVLQLGGRFDHLDQEQEATDNVVGYIGAIDSLSNEGLIDPKRVGIIGFSRTCWYVETALVHHPDRFAAATIADGIDLGYMQFMIYGPESIVVRRETEKIVGAAPFGSGLKKWNDLAPDYRLDKVTTPLRLEAIGPNSVLTEWEIYSSLRMQHKPVDLVYIPQDQHILQTPQDRFASEQGAVDWFTFWLVEAGQSGHMWGEAFKDTDQYKRWEHLRSLRDAGHKEAELTVDGFSKIRH